MHQKLIIRIVSYIFIYTGILYLLVLKQNSTLLFIFFFYFFKILLVELLILSIHLEDSGF